MNGNKFKIEHIFGRIITNKFNNTRHCHIYSKYDYFIEYGEKYRFENYRDLPTIMNSLQNIQFLTINIKEINTMWNMDKNISNLPCLLNKMTFRLFEKFLCNKFSLGNFNFIHRLKIPYDCKIEFKFDNITFEVVEIDFYKYLIITDNKYNKKHKVKYTDTFDSRPIEYVKYIDDNIESLMPAPKYHYWDNIVRYTEKNDNVRKYSAKSSKNFNKNCR